MTKPNNITVLLEVYNESHRLETCLQSFQWAEELVVFVKKSDDDTYEIARKYATHVYAVDYCSASENILSNFARHQTKEWCFYITASCRIDPDLVVQVEKLTMDCKFDFDVIGLPYQMSVFGICGKSSPWGVEYKYSIIRKSALKLSTVLHQEIRWNSNKLYEINSSTISGRFYHLTHSNPDDFFLRHIRYIKYEADYYCRSYHDKAFNFAFRAFLRSMGSVVLKKRTIYRGRDGFVLSLAYVSYYLMLMVYVWYGLRTSEKN